MKKDAYYFPHFCNARHDRKLKRVQKELGIEGYGIYFMLIEVLREQEGFKYPLDDIDLLADEFGTSEQKIRTVISNYKLFTIDKSENFFSIKLNEYMQPYLTMKEQRRQAGIKSGKVRKLTAKTPKEEKSDLNQVYVIECWNDKERFIKIGATNSTISRRFSGKIPYEYLVLRQFFTEDSCYSLEEELHTAFKSSKYYPNIKFPGSMECYSISLKNNIVCYKPKTTFSHEHCLNENEQSKVKKSKVKNNKEEDINLESEFIAFWMGYKKSKDKEKCFNKWKKLKRKEKDSIFRCLPSYVKSTPDSKFRKNPLTWLNGKCWEDEIIVEKKTTFIPCDLPEI